MKPTYIIYKHTGPTGGVYIGQTSSSIKKRWGSGHGYKTCPHFYHAIKKYGWDNFKHGVLFEGLTKEDADRIETELISKYKGLGHSYNLADGGAGRRKPHSDKTKLKIGQANRGKKASVTKRQKISNSLKSYYQLHPEQRHTISEQSKGRLHTEEWKDMMSRRFKGTKRPSNIGQTVSKKLIGRIRITNGVEGKMIYPNELKNYPGWVRGMVPRH